MDCSLWFGAHRLEKCFILSVSGRGRGKASGVTVNTDCKHPRKSGKEAALSRKLSYLVRTVILVTVRTDFREGDVIAVAGVRK